MTTTDQRHLSGRRPSMTSMCTCSHKNGLGHGDRNSYTANFQVWRTDKDTPAAPPPRERIFSPEPRGNRMTTSPPRPSAWSQPTPQPTTPPRPRNIVPLVEALEAIFSRRQRRYHVEFFKRAHLCGQANVVNSVIERGNVFLYDGDVSPGRLKFSLKYFGAGKAASGAVKGIATRKTELLGGSALGGHRPIDDAIQTLTKVDCDEPTGGFDNEELAYLCLRDVCDIWQIVQGIIDVHITHHGTVRGSDQDGTHAEWLEKLALSRDELVVKSLVDLGIPADLIRLQEARDAARATRFGASQMTFGLQGLRDLSAAQKQYAADRRSVAVQRRTTVMTRKTLV